MPLITLKQAVKEKAKYCVNPPLLSLFRCTPTGEYILLVQSYDVDEIGERFKTEAVADFMNHGLEIRCNGETVHFGRV